MQVKILILWELVQCSVLVARDIRNVVCDSVHILCNSSCIWLSSTQDIVNSAKDVLLDIGLCVVTTLIVVIVILGV